MTYRDPPSLDTRHPIFELSDRLDEATDAFMAAIDREAEAQAAFDRVYAIELVKHDDVPVTIRDKVARALAVDEQIALTFAHAAAQRCRAKRDGLAAQLSAWQTYLRFERDVT